jgi:hypothetical protein
VIAILAAMLCPIISWIESKAEPQVIVCAAQDQVYAEPILREFEKETGIKVNAVYDSEAVKTVGLANRLVVSSQGGRRGSADQFQLQALAGGRPRPRMLNELIRSMSRI